MTPSLSSQPVLVLGEAGDLRQALAEQLHGAGRLVEVLSGSDEGFEPAFANALEKCSVATAGGLVVNLVQSGAASGEDLESMDMQTFQRLLDDQLATPWRLLRRLLPAMRPRGGVVVNVLADAERGFCFTGALSMLGRCAAIEGGGEQPVRVHTVIAAEHPSVAEVASAVAFLCSDGAGYMSGNVLSLGGRPWE